MINRNGNRTTQSAASKSSFKLIMTLGICIISVVAITVVGSGGWAETAKEKAMPAEADKIAARTDVCVRGGYSAFILAQNVREILNAAGKEYFILSVQDAADFRRGHVPAAINVPFENLAKKESLAKIPKNRKVIVTCSDGHRSNAAALFLNQIGYDATAMVMGLNAWNKDSAGRGAGKPYAGSRGYPVSTDNVALANRSDSLPDVRTGEKTVEDMIRARTDEYLSAKRNLVVEPQAIYEKTVKSDRPEYFLLSIQKAEDYSLGHVSGAINIPYTEIGKKENLLKLPTDMKIAVICYIGHSASSVALFLNQLGYEAYAMQYGTMGWNDTTDGLGPQKKIMQAAIQSQGFETESD